MTTKRYFVIALVISILACFIVSGGSGIRPAENPADFQEEKVSNPSMFTIEAFIDYTAAVTIILLSLTAVPLVSLIYSNRLKKTEADLTKLTEERENLRIEINKSLNGTFAVISSMISMQILNSEKEETKQKLAEINDRIMSISLVHENLLQSKNSSKVNIHEVFTKLGERLIRIYVLGGDIGFEVKGEECFIEMTRAVPLCIVMNEIISNSLKFAFTDKISGKISVEYNCRNDKIELCVRDNGIGIPERLMCENQDSLGLNLIRNIVALQLNGSADLRTESGTKWLISFPVKGG